MKILITGADGLVGEAVGRVLAAGGDEIIKINGPNFKRVEAANLNDKRSFTVDLTDGGEVEKLFALENISLIIHSAGLAHLTDEAGGERFFEINVGATKNICELGAKLKVGRIILISTVAVYGDSESKKSSGKSGLDEKSVCQPAGLYAQSKLKAEQTAVEFCRQYQINLTILRLSTVVGEGDTANYYRLIRAIEKKRFMRIGDGSNRKSLIYKDDVGRACRMIIKRSAEFCEVYNLAAEALTIEEIIEILAASLGKKVSSKVIPSSPFERLCELNERTINLKLLRNLRVTIKKWLAEDVFSADKILNKYEFSPSVSAREALRIECDWYLKSKKTK